MKKRERERTREKLNLTRLKQACKTMALFLVCCWIRRQPLWRLRHHVSFLLGGGGSICMGKELRDQSIIRGWGAGADSGWISNFYARIQGGGGRAAKIFLGVLTIFLKTLIKVSSDKQPKLFVLKTKCLLHL